MRTYGRARYLLNICTTLVPLFLLFQSTVFGQDRATAATVHVQIVDASGKDLGKAQIETFQSETTNKDGAGLFRNNVASGIPFGTYRMKVHAPGFWTASRRVRVFQADTWVVVQLDLGMSKEEGGLQTFEVSGRVTSVEPQAGQIWIRLAGVYSDILVDSKTDASGNFRMAGVPAGDYVLITTRNGNTLDCRAIKVRADQRITIDLQSQGKRAAKAPVTLSPTIIKS